MALKRPEGFSDAIWSSLTDTHYSDRYRWVSHREMAAPLLDIGCGQGYQSALLAMRLGHITAIDSEHVCIETTRKMARLNNANITVFHARAEELPFPAGAFATVTCFEVLEHVDDPAPVMAEVVRVLAPGGRFIASVPREGVLATYPGHLRDFSTEGFLALVSSAGLTLLDYHKNALFQMVSAVKP